MKWPLIIIALILAGCATKQYPISVPLSSGEESFMSCNDLHRENIKLDQVETQINITGTFDAKSVFGVLGDFGLGNGMAKSNARKALHLRRQDVRSALARKGCLNAGITT